MPYASAEKQQPLRAYIQMSIITIMASGSDTTTTAAAAAAAADFSKNIPNVLSLTKRSQLESRIGNVL